MNIAAAAIGVRVFLLSIAESIYAAFVADWGPTSYPSRRVKRPPDQTERIVRRRAGPGQGVICKSLKRKDKAVGLTPIPVEFLGGTPRGLTAWNRKKSEVFTPTDS